MHPKNVYDLRLGRATLATLTRDWRQVARASRATLAKDDARLRDVIGATRSLWRVSRALKRARS